MMVSRVAALTMTTVLRSASVLAFAAAALAASAQNLVVNPSFETYDFSGWTTTGSPQVAGVVNAGNGDRTASQGSYFAALSFYSSSAGDSIRQTLPTAAGARYTVSFDLSPLSARPNNATPVSTFLVMFANKPLLTLTNPAPTNYVPYTFTVDSLLGNDTLSFSSTSTTHEGIFALDNIRVTLVPSNPTPEPATFAALGFGAVAFVKRRKRA